ncbi:hypothetical protein TRVL_04919 [Trypanosoma vivax]|uniref:Uncharacterized protein n=1 Tax=Trypanosoma vivax (strain Y486) TaxID=1055687 RepID=G0TX08_TRYVY|nr:hypothetical protein TRVL_04919 [Trypanosoma vivax]CCC48497.1 hypothetical protein TVY486_0602880 [Trypanosoma vivax Y486]
MQPLPKRCVQQQCHVIQLENNLRAIKKWDGISQSRRGRGARKAKATIKECTQNYDAALFGCCLAFVFLLLRMLPRHVQRGTYAGVKYENTDNELRQQPQRVRLEKYQDLASGCAQLAHCTLR